MMHALTDPASASSSYSELHHSSAVVEPVVVAEAEAELASLVLIHGVCA